MKKNKFKYLLLGLLTSFPLLSFAALDGVKGFLVSFGGLLNLVIKIIFGLTLVFFFWGTGQFILHAGDATAREDGKKKMLWGVIALFVAFSIFGILAFINNIFGIQGVSTNTPPTAFPSDLQPQPLFQGDAIPGTINI